MNTVSIKNNVSVEELQELTKVFALAFETNYTTTDEYLKTALQNASAIFVVALFNQKIVGGLVAFEMTPLHGTKEIYIYDIAVHPLYQKQGIGRKLIEHLQGEAKARGATTIFVEAESEDKDAVAFYRAIGGEEEQVNHFNFNIY